MGNEFTPAQWIQAATILVGTCAAFCTLILQVRAKRQDEKLASQLARINRQLSELYGPLFAFYEAGQRNWFLFVAQHSNDTAMLHQREFFPDLQHFEPPNAPDLSEYRRRMEQLFMPTNEEMEKLISRIPI